MAGKQTKLKSIFDSTFGRPGDSVIILAAVSGGADSCALLGLLAESAKSDTGRRIVVAHYNHKLRPEADDEELFVRELGKRFGCEVISDSGDALAFAADSNISIHSAARTLRYRFLGTTARHLIAETPSIPVYIATAHHRDDQVETILMRLFSGSGVEGLAGMKPVSPCPGAPEIPLTRPLLGIAKKELIDYCHGADIAFVEDQSNLDNAYPRNSIRANILPAIIESFGEGVVGSILRSGELMQLTADFLSGEIDRCIKECQVSSTITEIIVDYRAFSSYFYLVRLGTLQRFARLLTGDNVRIPLERFRAAEAIVTTGDKEIELGGGIKVRRFRENVYIYSANVFWNPIKFAEGCYEIPGVGVLTVRLVPAMEVNFPPAPGTLYIDAGCADFTNSKIRPAVYGDVMEPLGAEYTCSAFDMLREAEYPRHKRNAPVLEVDGVIAAILPIRIAHKFRLTADSRQAYRLTMTFPSASDSI